MEILETVRDKVPSELFTMPFSNPVGGDPQVMTATSANIGSAALSAFVFHRAGQPDPVDLLGALFVIEGLGLRNAAGWADHLAASLGLRDDQLSFLRYHAVGDAEHFQLLTGAFPQT